MKKCTYCGKEYPDNATECAIDSSPLVPVIPPIPPTNPSHQTTEKQTGQAIASLVLGILSVSCFGFFAGIPAIILGHIARGKSEKSPDRYGGGGMALAGLIMGYVSIFLTLLIMPAMLLPALARAKDRAQSINCMNNMKQIGLSFRTWALDHENEYPANVSSSQGGAKERSALGRDGFDKDSAFQFEVMSNVLFTPRILVCPADKSKQVALSFQNLQPANASYKVRLGPNIGESNPQEVLAVCPIHGYALMCDGSVQARPRPRK